MQNSLIKNQVLNSQDVASQNSYTSNKRSKVKGPMYRQVTIEAAQKFAKEENLIFVGETSCRDNLNCIELFNQLIEKVH
jgi:hypothetical protein